MTGGWKCGSPDSSTCCRYTGSAGTTRVSMKSRSCFWSSSDRALNSKSTSTSFGWHATRHPEARQRRTSDVRSAFEVGLLAVTWAIGWLLCWRLPRLSPVADAAPTRRVSVIVPARNEAARLPGLLAALASQTHPAEEVLVV